MTAAEAMSLALPDRGCRPAPMRSTVFSTALFKSSTITSKNSGSISISHSTIDCASQTDIGSKKIATLTSCLNAASCTHASYMPRKEFLIAEMSRLIPFSPGFIYRELTS